MDEKIITTTEDAVEEIARTSGNSGIKTGGAIGLGILLGASIYFGVTKLIQRNKLHKEKKDGSKVVYQNCDCDDVYDEDDEDSEDEN